jgi:hypothetical protein
VCCVEIAGRTLLDQGRAAERARWTEKAQHIPGLVHQLTGPEAGMPAEIERWESWHLAYVQKLADRAAVPGDHGGEHDRPAGRCAL